MKRINQKPYQHIESLISKGNNRIGVSMREMNNANVTKVNGNKYTNTYTLINTSNTKANNNKHEKKT